MRKKKKESHLTQTRDLGRLPRRQELGKEVNGGRTFQAGAAGRERMVLLRFRHDLPFLLT